MFSGGSWSGSFHNTKPVKVGGTDEQQIKVQYAWDISNGDKDFLYMIEGESSTWDETRQSEVVKNGKREASYGICQIHKGYHPRIVKDPRFFTDWKWQIDQCYKLWKGGTPFYGYNNKWRIKEKIAFQENTF